MDLSTMRFRERARYETRSNTSGNWKTYDRNGQLTNSWSAAPSDYASNQVTDQMWDVVTPQFHRKRSSGAVVNSPMKKELVTIDRPLMDVSERTVFSGGDSLRYVGKVAPELPDHTLTTPQSAIDVAVTAAYAGVTANEENALLWLGEFKETISMFSDMGRRLIYLVNATAKQRKRYAKGLLSIEEAQSLTLGLLYGLLPLQQSVEQWQKGLLRHKANGRQTSRGYNTYTNTANRVIDIGDANFKWEVAIKESISTNIRAGVLYEVELPAYPVLTHFDIKSFVSTAYALSRLSFVWDWFLNVGNTLAAWSPAMGTTERSAWVTVEENLRLTAINTWSSKLQAHEKSQIHTGSQTATRYTVRKTRIPVSRSDLDLLPNINIQLNLDKIFALILLFAKVKDKP